MCEYTFGTIKINLTNTCWFNSTKQVDTLITLIDAFSPSITSSMLFQSVNQSVRLLFSQSNQIIDKMAALRAYITLLHFT